jgi:hypothetical protein
MCVEHDSNFEPMDDFERELSAAMRRKPAAASLKRGLMERRRRERAEQHRRMVWFERLAASVVLAGAVGGALAWHSAEQKRRGEEAKQQVFTALRITNRALQQMKVQLEERDSR